MRIFVDGRARWALVIAISLISGFPISGPISTAKAEPAAGEPVPILTVERAVSIALEDNPGLAQIRARAVAAAAIPSQRGSLPDPSITVRALNLPTNTFDRHQENMTQVQFGFSQAIPFPGKLRLRKEAAQHESDAAAADVEEARLGLVRDVKSGWWEVFYLDRAIDTVLKNQKLLREFVEIARTKYTVGQGLQQDVLLAEVELSKLLDREVDLKSRRRSAAASLLALLDRPTAQPMKLPANEGSKFHRPPPETVLFEIAERARPLLLSLKDKVSAATSRRNLAKRDFFPDFKLDAGYGIRDRDLANNRNRADFLSMGLNITVPLYAASKQSKALEQRVAELNRAQLQLADERARVNAQITTFLARFDGAAEQTELYRSGILPQARQTVEAMRAGYLVNQVDFLNLVSSQITLFNYETRFWRVLSNANSALAALAAAAGKEIFDE